MAGAAYAEGDAAPRTGASAWLVFFVMILTCVAIHTLSLYAGILLAKRAGIDRSAQIAVGIAGSQKTLMVGLQIAIDLGVSVIPMLAYHIGQLIIDTIIADRWKQD